MTKYIDDKPLSLIVSVNDVCFSNYDIEKKYCACKSIRVISKRKDKHI